MFDLEIELPNTPGSLSDMGNVLGQSGVSVEGGGAWVVGDVGVAHFLFVDGDKANRVLSDAGFRVLACREVVTVRLKQDVPGQLGMLTGRMAESGVNIHTLYSDHDNQLIVVPDDLEKARVVAREWPDNPS